MTILVRKEGHFHCTLRKLIILKPVVEKVHKSNNGGKSTYTVIKYYSSKINNTFM